MTGWAAAGAGGTGAADGGPPSSARRFKLEVDRVQSTASLPRLACKASVVARATGGGGGKETGKAGLGNLASTTRPRPCEREASAHRQRHGVAQWRKCSVERRQVAGVQPHVLSRPVVAQTDDAGGVGDGDYSRPTAPGPASAAERGQCSPAASGPGCVHRPAPMRVCRRCAATPCWQRKGRRVPPLPAAPGPERAPAATSRRRRRRASVRCRRCGSPCQWPAARQPAPKTRCRATHQVRRCPSLRRGVPLHPGTARVAQQACTDARTDCRRARPPR